MDSGLAIAFDGRVSRHRDISYAIPFLILIGPFHTLLTVLSHSTFPRALYLPPSSQLLHYPPSPVPNHTYSNDRCFSAASSSSGNPLTKSLNLSIGAINSPAKTSAYGLFGAPGWLLVGVIIFVLSKLFARAWDSSRDRADSRRGMSSVDSCSMCVWRSVMRRSRRRVKLEEEGERDWRA